MKLERYEGNPILKPNPENWWESYTVFNPGAVLKDGKVYLLYRAVGERKQYISRLGLAISGDGFNFERVSTKPVFEPGRAYDRWACEDPRIIELEGEIYITYVALSKLALMGGKLSYTALLSTKDFRNFKRFGLITSRKVDDRDTVLFSEKIKGKYAMLHRPQEYTNSDLDYWEWKTGDPSSIWLAFSKDIKRWGMGQVLMKPQEEWEQRKIGIGPPPIKTTNGWLLIYHGVDKNSVYRAGAALLDLNDPTKVIGRLSYPILEPEEDYEKIGDVPNVVFPCGAVILGKKLFIYYGGADEVCCVATKNLNDILECLR